MAMLSKELERSSALIRKTILRTSSEDKKLIRLLSSVAAPTPSTVTIIIRFAKKLARRQIVGAIHVNHYYYSLVSTCCGACAWRL